MTITLREVTRENWIDCVKLKVADDQTAFVASNVFSLAQAKFEPESEPFAIYNDETMVGFIMFHREEDEAGEKTWFIERVMVDQRYQRKGYGRRAMELLLERLKAVPGYAAVYISFVPENAASRHLYSSVGFKDSGEMLEGEVLFRLALPATN